MIEWSDGHDVMLCREILYEDPFQFKKGSPERGEVWSKIARAPNSCTELNFNVKQRSVRERFTLLQVKYKETNRKDEAGSGTSRQVSELDQLLEDITEKEKDSEESRNVVNAKKDDQDREKAENIRKTAMETNRTDESGSGTSRQVSELDQLLEDITEKEKDSEESRNVVNAKKDDQDREKAEKIRKTAMERIGQTKKRREEGEETVSTKRKRRSGDETIGYLREKSETERKVREQEIELKKAQVALQQQQAAQSQAQMQEMMMVIQQQQQQSQNKTALLVQQQQQFMSLMQSFLKKPQ